MIIYPLSIDVLLKFLKKKLPLKQDLGNSGLTWLTAGCPSDPAGLAGPSRAGAACGGRVLPPFQGFQMYH